MSQPTKTDLNAAKDLLSLILGEHTYPWKLKKTAEHFARHRERFQAPEGSQP